MTVKIPPLSGADFALAQQIISDNVLLVLMGHCARQHTLGVFQSYLNYEKMSLSSRKERRCGMNFLLTWTQERQTLNRGQKSSRKPSSGG